MQYSALIQTIRQSHLLRLFLTLGIVLNIRPLFADPVTIVIPLDSHDAKTRESNFGNAVADAILAAAPGADFAVSPGIETKPDTIDAGKSTTQRIDDDLRGENDPADTVVIMSLTGAQVHAALVHSVSRVPNSFDGFLQVSGLTVKYDPAKQGDQRIVSIIVAKTGRPLQADKTYSVAMPHFLADGGLGYFSIWAKAPPPTDTHTLVSDAVTHFVVAHQPLSSRVEGRIVSV